mgnify:CR=1 FL=1
MTDSTPALRELLTSLEAGSPKDLLFREFVKAMREAFEAGRKGGTNPYEVQP